VKDTSRFARPTDTDAETYADYPQMGRFTLRDKVQSSVSVDAEIPLTLEQGNTIAIGKITKLITEPTG